MPGNSLRSQHSVKKLPIKGISANTNQNNQVNFGRYINLDLMGAPVVVTAQHSVSMQTTVLTATM